MNSSKKSVGQNWHSSEGWKRRGWWECNWASWLSPVPSEVKLENRGMKQGAEFQSALVEVVCVYTQDCEIPTIQQIPNIPLLCARVTNLSQKGLKKGQPPPSGGWHHHLSQPSSSSFCSAFILIIVLLTQSQHWANSLMSLVSDWLPGECTLGLQWLLAIFWRDFPPRKFYICFYFTPTWQDRGQWGAQATHESHLLLWKHKLLRGHS